MTGTLSPTAIALYQSPLLLCPVFPTRVSKSYYFTLQFFHQEIPTITEATMESTLIKAIQREEVMTKHWDCKLMFKEEEDGPEINLLDYVNLSEEEEDKIPKNRSHPNFCLYKFPNRLNGLEDWPKLKKELHLSGIASGCSLISNHVKILACGKKYHVTCHHYHTYKEKVSLKRKYEDISDYMDGIATTTMKQNRLIEMRRPIGAKQSQKTQTILPTCKDKRCHFGFKSSVDQE
jgi:hypothetical protein